MAAREVSVSDRALDIRFMKGFGELRSIARKLLLRRRTGHIMQPTQLVNESFLRLLGMRGRIENTKHFYNLCARTMKQVVIDYGRVHDKRICVLLESVPERLWPMSRQRLDADRVLELKIALKRLTVLDNNAAEAIRLRYMEGMTIGETSRVLNRSPATVRVDCEFGLKWMKSHLEDKG